jgi:hypothetical protein
MATSMSFCRGVSKTAGSQPLSCHWLVQGWMYSRVGLVGEVRVPTVPLARLSHFSVALAELPTVVRLGWPVAGSMSQAWPVSAVRTVRSQPRCPVRHQRSRLSREE